MRGLLGMQTAGGARRQALTQHAGAHLRPRNLEGAAAGPMDPGLQAGALLPPPSSGGGLLRLRWDSPLSSMR